MTNRRLNGRRRRRFKLTFGRTSCFTVDASAGGVCAELIRGLPPGAKVEGSIWVGGNDVLFAGMVAWLKPGDVCLGLRARIGVRFTRIGEEFSKAIEWREEAGRSPAGP